MKVYKTGMALAIAAAAVLAVSSPAMAGEYANDAASKFTRGLANTATGWGEIPKNIALESEESNVLVGITYGTVKGVFHTVGRTVVGALELGTFFIPNDEVVQSTYVWENTNEETTYDL
ncbi:MAG: exosortase system-associated protein, TIGR04073 family [Mariprofundaceae bacterium]|nr:exosortase system-associated protein, TIGR04073 family [Mariprofundaceae bacterium]